MGSFLCNPNNLPRTFSFNKNMVDKLTSFQLIALILQNRDFIMSNSDCLIQVSSTI